MPLFYLRPLRTTSMSDSSNAPSTKPEVLVFPGNSGRTLEIPSCLDEGTKQVLRDYYERAKKIYPKHPLDLLPSEVLIWRMMHSKNANTGEDLHTVTASGAAAACAKFDHDLDEPGGFGSY